jgi:hypothetical protein
MARINPGPSAPTKWDDSAISSEDHLLGAVMRRLELLEVLEGE